MPTIIKVVLINNIPRIGVISCTDEEFEQYKKENSFMDNDHHYIQTTFLEKYLSEHTNRSIKLFETEGLALTGEKFMIESGWARFVTLNNVKQILSDAGLDYKDFIDAYCTFLTTS